MWWDKRAENKANKTSKMKHSSQFMAALHADYKKGYVQFAKYYWGRGKGSQKKCTAFYSVTSLGKLLVSTGFTQFETASVILLQTLNKLPQHQLYSWVRTQDAR